MDSCFGEALRPFLEFFRDALTANLGNKLSGLYLYGSIALGDFDELNSDIDFLCVLDRQMSGSEIQQVEAWHEEAAVRQKYGSRLDGQYILRSDVGKSTSEIAPYPAVCAGTFRASTHWDSNAVTWWILKTRGVTLYGVLVPQLCIPVTCADVEREMVSNLRDYWPGRLSRPETFDTVGDCVDAVLTLCRILNTLMNGTIESKCVSADRVCKGLPNEWCTLVDDAVHLRRAGVSMQLPADKCMRDRTRNFIRYTIDFCTIHYLSGR